MEYDIVVRATYTNVSQYLINRILGYKKISPITCTAYFKWETFLDFEQISETLPPEN